MAERDANPFWMIEAVLKSLLDSAYLSLPEQSRDYIPHQCVRLAFGYDSQEPYPFDRDKELPCDVIKQALWTHIADSPLYKEIVSSEIERLRSAGRYIDARIVILTHIDSSPTEDPMALSSEQEMRINELCRKAERLGYYVILEDEELTRLYDELHTALLKPELEAIIELSQESCDRLVRKSDETTLVLAQLLLSKAEQHPSFQSYHREIRDIETWIRKPLYSAFRLKMVAKGQPKSALVLRRT